MAKALSGYVFSLGGGTQVPVLSQVPAQQLPLQQIDPDGQQVLPQGGWPGAQQSARSSVA